MAGSVKLFQFFQQIHQLIGFSPQSHPIQKYQETILYLIKTFLLLCCAQLILATAAFLALESQSILDFALAFYVLISLINGMVIYSVFIWESENTFEFIENCEGFIGKSKYYTHILCEEKI